MAYQNGTATDYKHLLDILRRFVCGYGTAAAPVAGANTGDGTVTGVDTHPASVTETITLTCTAAATDGGTFSVVGSVTGALADATVGTPYTSAVIDFTINDGATDFIVGDSFAIAVTQGAMSAAGSAWTQLEWTGSASTEGRLQLRAPGLSGSEEIYVQLQSFSDAGSDYYNWYLWGSLGYIAGYTPGNQPQSSVSRTVSFWNDPMPYWLVANGQRVILVAKVSTTYHALYAGKFLPYATPGQYPYPVFIGGEGNVGTVRWSSTSINTRHFVDPGEYGARVYYVDGTWLNMVNWYNNSGTETRKYDNIIWPVDWNWVRDNIDGGYTLFPFIINIYVPTVGTVGVLGELDGAYYISGFGLAVEDIVTIDAKQYLVVQNVFRTGIGNYWALKLE